MGFRATWTKTDSQDNAAATATRAAAAGRRHLVTGVSAGFGAAKGGALLTIKDGGAIIWRTRVFNTLQRPFNDPIVITAGNGVSAELEASGTTGVFGDVTLEGYSEAG